MTRSNLRRVAAFFGALALVAIVAMIVVPSALTQQTQSVASLPNALKYLAFVGATNTLGNYNETFFAQEALIQLEKVMGMAGRVYRDYTTSPSVKGDTIQIRRPSYFTAQSAPSTDQNVATTAVSVQLSHWDEVKFSITDKDLSLTSDRLITDHIRPAAVALADKIDQNLITLYKDIPWVTTMSATPALADISAIRKVMFSNKVPLKDQDNLHFMIGGTEEAAFLNAMTVLQNQQASGLRDGSIGRLYGYDVWANQNTTTHTSGGAADAVGALTVATAVGGTTVTFNGVTASAAFNKGDVIVITGDPQQYVVQTTTSADGTGLVTGLPVYPAISQVNNIGAVITLTTATGKTQNLAFHRNAFALATAPLSDLGNQLGARIAVINDPITGISLRSRLFYDGDNSRVKVALDVLYGYVTLDGNLAVRGFSA
jgi:hypothetical protein